MKQAPHPSGRVVSVRMPDEIIERLDALCDRTGRSRGFYLKMAITAMLPKLEE
ncbi:MAG: ribbon-helix-helix domain-containing protein, partial [Corynebacterium sp.]|nr:ribbon-helix-helix domain-containing protein [Corynebacterium sp.]